ncbi:MAG TPA: hypothetical protein VKS99_09845, partial [Blastocatellia bacterium]|nr:hypothetical protein [Blastocatellia bacterium]
RPVQIKQTEKCKTEKWHSYFSVLHFSVRDLNDDQSSQRPCHRFISRLLEFAFCCSILYPRHLLAIANV